MFSNKLYLFDTFKQTQQTATNTSSMSQFILFLTIKCECSWDLLWIKSLNANVDLFRNIWCVAQLWKTNWWKSLSGALRLEIPSNRMKSSNLNETWKKNSNGDSIQKLVSLMATSQMAFFLLHWIFSGEVWPESIKQTKGNIIRFLMHTIWFVPIERVTKCDTNSHIRIHKIWINFGVFPMWNMKENQQQSRIHNITIMLFWYLIMKWT